MEKYQNEKLSFQERAEDLVNHMTLEECMSQMLFGSAKVEHLGIQAYNWWNEALHGVARCGMATLFPQAIGMAASFDEKLLKKVADVISTEGRAKYNMYQKYGDYGIYKGITFWSPNVNIFRDPRWGRGQETYGEDPYLTSRLGVAFVEGLQGDDPRYLKTAACAKHFAAHSGPEKKRHEFNAVASSKDMAETYLPAFKSLADCGVEGFMGAYNRTNGEPCCGSETLLVKLLRGEWEFTGYITSDCWAISDFHQHHKVTDGPTDSVALAVKNGCDLNCGCMYDYLMQTYEEGKITEEQVRASVVHLMQTRMKLGMFDESTPFDSIGTDVLDCKEHQQINEKITQEAMVLLKNNGILPLDKNKIKSIAVIGPNANSIVALEGNYHGTANSYTTILEGIQQEFSNTDTRVNYSEGSHLYEYKLEDPGYAGDRLAEVKSMTDEADVVVLVTGMDETIEGEEMPDKDLGGDKADLYLPQCQRDLIKTACERNTPVILVNLTGSAVDFDYGNEHADAIIQGWYPGSQGGKVVADLLFGKFSPSGRLPITFYRNDNQLPDFEDYSMDGRTYKYIKEAPLFPFGYGLSYTTFSYRNLSFINQEFAVGEALQGSVKVKNTGAVSGEEVVQVYVKDIAASVRVPHHELCAVKRIMLEPGKEVTVDFTIAAEAFMLINEEGSKEYEPGEFLISVGGTQPDKYSESLKEAETIKEIVKMRG